MARLYRHVYSSPVGDILLLSSEAGLCFVGLPNISTEAVEAFVQRNFKDAVVEDNFSANRQAENELAAYFAGTRREFTLSLDLKADGFLRDVLLMVTEIPYGKLRTYGDIAKALGQPGAAQAVGNANSANPIPIIIPCHRVVASNGLGGYGGGIALKKKLLAIEQKETIF